MTTERRFRAMGSVARVIVVTDEADGAKRLLDQAQARIEELESRWSRFRRDSELCRLNATAGQTAVVSAETFALITRAVDAWFLTEGRYDPTVLPALIDAGCDRTLVDVRDRDGDHRDKPRDEPHADPIALPAVGLRAAPGCAEIRLGPSARTVSLPVGVQLDLGGIGKGYAADLVAAELLAAGARGACVSIGGDLRCMGTPPWDEGWLVEVDDPFAARADVDTAKPLMLLSIREGAVATTARTKRAWTHLDPPAHHVVDPATGRPADSGLAAVTVLAGEAWWAEVFAKAAFLAGPVEGLEVLAKADVSGFLVDDRGEVHRACRLGAVARV
jgi:thiamine biosynthesis lipoprotein